MKLNNNEIKRYHVVLTSKQKEKLEQIIKKGQHSSREVKRALILLNCDEGENGNAEKSTTKQIAEILKVGTRTIERVKKNFVQEGFERALKAKSPNRVYKRKLDGDAEAHLIALSCSEAPEGFSGWSLRLLADKMVELSYVDSVSYQTIRRTLKKTN